MLVLCILFNLALLCQGHKSTNDGLGFGYPEAEEENPSKKNAQVGLFFVITVNFH